MRILGPATALHDLVQSNIGAYNPHPRFVNVNEMFGPLWDSAGIYGVDPVGVIAQAGKETGWGHFPGKVKAEFHNPCGLKVRYQNLFPELAGDQPLAHAMFPNWAVGARAHVQHLRAYAGSPLPASELIVDPRYVYVNGKQWCENWSDLGGKWAPSPTYGTEIEALMLRLVGKAGS